MPSLLMKTYTTDHQQFSWLPVHCQRLQSAAQQRRTTAGAVCCHSHGDSDSERWFQRAPALHWARTHRHIKIEEWYSICSFPGNHGTFINTLGCRWRHPASIRLPRTREAILELNNLKLQTQRKWNWQRSRWPVTGLMAQQRTSQASGCKPGRRPLAKDTWTTDWHSRPYAADISTEANSSCFWHEHGWWSCVFARMPSYKLKATKYSKVLQFNLIVDHLTELSSTNAARGFVVILSLSRISSQSY